MGWGKITDEMVPGLDQPAVAYDTPRHRALIFGGATFELPAWQMTNTVSWWDVNGGGGVLAASGEGPDERMGSSAFCLGDNFYVFGGLYERYGSGTSNLYALDLTSNTWNPVWRTNDLQWGAGKIHGVLWHAPDGLWKVVAVSEGGNAAYRAISQDSLEWRPLNPTNRPPWARGRCVVFDAGNDRVLMFGGQDDFYNPPIYYNQVWALPLSGPNKWQWSPLDISTPPAPEGRSWAGAAYDSVRHQMVLFGGQKYNAQTGESMYGAGTLLNDLFLLSLPVGGGTAHWGGRGVSFYPPARVGTGAAFLDGHEAFMIVGGYKHPGQILQDEYWLNLDVTPPATVSDLRVGSVGCEDIHLLWTAPGDDSTAGQAVEYQLRVSTEPITDDETFWLAEQIPTGPPQVAGATEEVEYTVGPCSDRLYFVVRALDSRENISGLSNHPHGQTPCPPGGCDGYRRARDGRAAPDELAVQAATPRSVGTGVTFTLTFPAAARGRPWVLGLHDLAGRCVVELGRGEWASAGSQVHWNGTACDGGVVRPGIYFARLTAASGVATRRVVLVP